MIAGMRGPVVGLLSFGMALLLAPGAAATPVEQALRTADAPPAQLEATSVRALPSGSIVTRFGQEVGGVPVQGTGAVVLDTGGGAPQLLFDKTDASVASPGNAELSRAQAIAAAKRAAGIREASRPAAAELVIAGEGAGTLAWEVLQPSARPLGDFLVTVDAASGDVISKHNLIRHATGQAELFDPNPVVANDGYGGLEDRKDQDSSNLTSLREPIALEHLADGQTCLKGDYATVRESEAGNKVCKDSLDWSNIKRESDKFEALMAYAHIDRTQVMIQALDLLSINAEPQNVVANGLADDNSFYQPSQDEIRLGTGGVDDGEDGDVIVHEYGHAVQDAQNPAAYRGAGRQAGAQGEGFGDYLAGAYSTEMTGFDLEWTPCVMEWDATSYDADTPSSPGICLRRADNPNTWDEQIDDCGGREIHCIGEVWASALLDLRSTLGDDAEADSIMDTVVLASHEVTPPDPTFQDASEALIAADDSEYALDDHCVEIRDELVARGFLTGDPCV